GKAFECCADVFAITHVGTKRTNRSPRFRQMRASESNCCLDAGGDSNRQVAHFSLGGLKLHEDRCKPLCEIVVNVSREPVSLLENRLAPLLDPVQFRQPAVV